jgi:hypothetical protein
MERLVNYYSTIVVLHAWLLLRHLPERTHSINIATLPTSSPSVITLLAMLGLCVAATLHIQYCPLQHSYKYRYSYYTAEAGEKKKKKKEQYSKKKNSPLKERLFQHVVRQLDLL